MKITQSRQIDTPEIWVKLREEYDANNAIPSHTKTTKQHERWLTLRSILRRRWQTFTTHERNECVRLYGPIEPPGA